MFAFRANLALDVRTPAACAEAVFAREGERLGLGVIEAYGADERFGFDCRCGLA